MDATALGNGLLQAFLVARDDYQKRVRELEVKQKVELRRQEIQYQLKVGELEGTIKAQEQEIEGLRKQLDAQLEIAKQVEGTPEDRTPSSFRPGAKSGGTWAQVAQNRSRQARSM